MASVASRTSGRWRELTLVSIIFLFEFNRAAYDEKRLVPMESGIGSPCLDCRYEYPSISQLCFFCATVSLFPFCQGTM